MTSKSQLLLFVRHCHAVHNAPGGNTEEIGDATLAGRGSHTHYSQRVHRLLALRVGSLSFLQACLFVESFERLHAGNTCALFSDGCKDILDEDEYRFQRLTTLKRFVADFFLSQLRLERLLAYCGPVIEYLDVAASEILPVVAERCPRLRFLRGMIDRPVPATIRPCCGQSVDVFGYPSSPNDLFPASSTWLAHSTRTCLRRQLQVRAFVVSLHLLGRLYVRSSFRPYVTCAKWLV